ncbi:hypothetical protein BDF20DRAFT_834492 [Mycotypha africana]|uniref:uncharacterized protein n=1 Tax=Mycotypha africana TaxID=64632 RepID=UPI0023014794|nr:uncharacterized protein BDF20DRAFT_834492 [Mycotypha africana]KAI8981813.1 hypothetical protein BDF20DRAFT_834492 [Mycotypha africana]
MKATKVHTLKGLTVIKILLLRRMLYLIAKNIRPIDNESDSMMENVNIKKSFKHKKLKAGIVMALVVSFATSEARFFIDKRMFLTAVADIDKFRTSELSMTG